MMVPQWLVCISPPLWLLPEFNSLHYHVNFPSAVILTCFMHHEGGFDNI